jgi:PPOX class probable F420-dependent enzyme
MPTDEELWQLVVDHRQGILATIRRDGRPQLSNVLYAVDPGSRLVRITTTADRAKARNLARDGRAVLHVTGDDFWHFAAADCTAELSAVATVPGDEACRELLGLHGAFYGPLEDEPAFYDEMIANRRLVVRLSVASLVGVLSSGGRRPVPPESSDS